jgi:fructose-bisphosphate aldolase, class I
MKITKKVKQILDLYEGEIPSVKQNLARILSAGKLGGTGKMVILPVDQGLEHGPVLSFAPNPAAYDPHYHYKLAIDTGCNAYASVYGMLAAGADTFIGQVPTILKMNSSNLLLKSDAPDQAVTATVKQAAELGCAAIGFTIYPGSTASINQFEEIRDMIAEAKSYGIASVVWSYARGEAVAKEDETALDIIAYGAHIAAVLGAHIIKVKPPKAAISMAKAKPLYSNFDLNSLSARIAHIKQCCFNGRRLVVFSGGEAKGSDDVLAEIRQIRDGGGDGSIIGRNAFQRPQADSHKLLADIMDIYLNKK